MTDISSKHAIVSWAPYMLYMMLVDMRNLTRMLPEDKKQMVNADYDTLTASVQGFNVGVKVHERVPYSRISFVDWGAPFGFHVDVNFAPAPGDPYKTDLSVNLQADMNFMMKMMLEKKLKESLDKVVDSIAAVSEGRMPEGVDPSMFPEGFHPYGTGNPNDPTWKA